MAGGAIPLPRKGSGLTPRMRVSQTAGADTEVSYEPAPLAALARLPAYSWLVVGTVCIGAFMGQLDATIAQLVLPALEHSFHAAVRDVSWVAVAYLLTLAATLPIFGRLADMFGRKLLYTGGFVVFIAGSALCGFAPSLPVLIVARVFQALGAGLLQANSVAIVVAAAGERRRGQAIGIQAIAQALGLSTGPALGGLLIQQLGWRWVFWINVPIGIAGTVLGWYILPKTHGIRRDERFDWSGALLLAPALTAVLLAISEAAHWGLTSPAFVGTLSLGMVLLVTFVYRELVGEDPLIHPDLFKNRAFSAGNIAGFCSYAMLFGVFFVLPFVFERIYHDSALTAGLRLTIVPVVLASIAFVSGRLSDRYGPRPFTITGMVLAGAALLLMAWSIRAEDANVNLIMLALGVFGLGQGLFTAPNNSSIMGAASHDRLGAAGGVLNVMRAIGTSFGIAAATAILDARFGAGRASTALHPHVRALAAGAQDVMLFFAALALLATIASAFSGKSARARADGASEGPF